MVGIVHEPIGWKTLDLFLVYDEQMDTHKSDITFFESITAI